MFMSPHNPSMGASRKVISDRRILVAAFAIIALLLALVVAATPGHAEAKSYSMPKVDIQAQLETDGSLHVIEQRTFEFDGDYTKMKWAFYQMPSNAEVKANGVRIIDLDAYEKLKSESGESDTSSETNAEAGAGEEGSSTNSVASGDVISGGSASDVVSSSSLESATTKLSEESFALSYREDQEPGIECYSVDTTEKTIYVFFKDVPSRIIVELDYTVTNMAQVYDDVAEVYWQYLSSSWGQTTENITCKLELPLPKGTSATENNNVQAWGHGPSDGTVDVSESGVVTCTIPQTKLGEYAEVHLTIPKTWLTNVSQKALAKNSGTLRAETVAKDEKNWVDKEKARQVEKLNRTITVLIVYAVILIISLALYFGFGVEYKPDYKKKYYREIPSPEIHPVVIGRLWRWNKAKTKDLTAAILNLAQKKYIRINREDDGDEKRPQAYSFTCLVAIDEVTDRIDRNTLKLLFRVLGNQDDTISLEEIRAFGRREPEKLKAAVKQWNNIVTDEVNELELFDRRSETLSRGMFFAAIAVLVLLFCTVYSIANLIGGLVTCASMLVISHYIKRRTPKGNNIVARCKALRNWLRDFGTLDEAIPDNPETWGRFMVYAYQFDVLKNVTDQLVAARPELFEVKERSASMLDMLPWYVMATVVDGNLQTDASFADAITSQIEGSWSDSGDAGSDGGGFGFFGGDGGSFDGGGFDGGGFDGGGYDCG